MYKRTDYSTPDFYNATRDYIKTCITTARYPSVWTAHDDMAYAYYFDFFYSNRLTYIGFSGNAGPFFSFVDGTTIYFGDNWHPEIVPPRYSSDKRGYTC